MSEPQVITVKVEVPQAADIQSALEAQRTIPGINTSEFKLSMLAISAGVVLIALGLWRHDEAVTSQGQELIKWAVAGYAVSRGISKINTTPSAP